MDTRSKHASMKRATPMISSRRLLEKIRCRLVRHLMHASMIGAEVSLRATTCGCWMTSAGVASVSIWQSIVPQERC